MKKKKLIVREDPLSKKDQELLKTRPGERSAPVLKELRRWRAESIFSQIIFH